MKKIYYIISFIMLLGFTACDQWLTLEPENELTKEEYWKSKDDVQAMLASAYGALTNTYDEMFYWGEIRGGNITSGNSPGNAQTEMFNFNIFPESNLVQWGGFYKVINYANTLLKFAPQVTETDPSFTVKDLKAAEAEAIYIRSLCYFQLVKAFRDVPMILDPYIDDNKEVTVAKTDESEIISQIISDLEDIKQFAPTSYDVPDYAINYNKGRATLYAINALLADIYLWSNQYDLCIERCNDVINSYKFGLVSGDQYFTLFSPGNSIESIFELQSDKNLGQTNNLFSLTANFSGGSQDFQVSDEFVELFDLADKRGAEVSFDLASYSIWKYIGYVGGNTTIARTKSQSDANWIFYRLSELILMKSEAFFEKGELNNANEMLNIIRRRAGLSDAPMPEDESDLMQEILNERSKEFIGEGKRWFDLVRFARRDIENRKSLIANAVLLNVSPQYFVGVKSKINDPDSWFLPIYYKELEVNDLLEQNPFYKD